VAASPPAWPSLELEQPDRGGLVGHQHIEETAAQRAQKGMDLVQPAGDADDSRNALEVGQLDPYAAIVNGQVGDLAVAVEELFRYSAFRLIVTSPARRARSSSLPTEALDTESRLAISSWVSSSL
jgi:hypothetical protein